MAYIGRATLYFDGASRNNPRGPAGCGYRIVEMNRHGRDGEVVVEGYEYLGYDVSNTEAEYIALIKGLKLVGENLNVDHLYIRGDSDVVIQQCEGNYEVRSAHLRPLLDEVQELLRDICTYSYKFGQISRERNIQCDALANKAIEEGASGIVWC